jgi:hypothetical protein
MLNTNKTAAGPNRSPGFFARFAGAITGLLSPRFLAAHRNAAGPSGFLFLRNYKSRHMARLEAVIARSDLRGQIVISAQAYDSVTGKLLPEKVGVYAASHASSDLFFQFYAQVKSEEKSTPRTVFGVSA